MKLNKNYGNYSQTNGNYSQTNGNYGNGFTQQRGKYNNFSNRRGGRGGVRRGSGRNYYDRRTYAQRKAASLEKQSKIINKEDYWADRCNKDCRECGQLGHWDFDCKILSQDRKNQMEVAVLKGRKMYELKQIRKEIANRKNEEKTEGKLGETQDKQE